MPLMLRPEPMPVDVISELAAAALDVPELDAFELVVGVVELVVGVVELVVGVIVELIDYRSRA
jgi:hypothetical protein